jgi:hypothetical protein
MTMQDKLIEILSAATVWMTATELADKGKWRSAAHVGLALKQMPNVEHRTSPNKKMGNGMPAKEYKLVDKVFPDDLASTKSSPISSKSTVKEAPTAAQVLALKKEIDDRDQIISVMRSTLGIKDGDSIRLAIEKLKSERDACFQAEMKWERTMMELVGEDGIGSVTKAIEKLQADLGNARIQIGALNEQLIHEDAAVDVKDAAKGYLVCAPKRKPAKVTKAESAVVRAKSAAKSTGRSEVFALVPVGVATRKKVKAVEYRERVA